MTSQAETDLRAIQRKASKAQAALTTAIEQMTKCLEALGYVVMLKDDYEQELSDARDEGKEDAMETLEEDFTGEYVPCLCGHSPGEHALMGNCTRCICEIYELPAFEGAKP